MTTERIEIEYVICKWIDRKMSKKREKYQFSIRLSKQNKKKQKIYIKSS